MRKNVKPPRYIVHRDGVFGGQTFYVKVYKDKYTIWDRNGNKIKLPIRTTQEHKSYIKSVEQLLKEGIWREVNKEELVLMP